MCKAESGSGIYWDLPKPRCNSQVGKHSSHIFYLFMKGSCFEPQLSAGFPVQMAGNQFLPPGKTNGWNPKITYVKRKKHLPTRVYCISRGLVINSWSLVSSVKRMVLPWRCPNAPCFGAQVEADDHDDIGWQNAGMDGLRLYSVCFSLPQNGGNLDQLGIWTLKRKLNFQVQARRQVLTFRKGSCSSCYFYNQDLDRIVVASG